MGWRACEEGAGGFLQSTGVTQELAQFIVTNDGVALQFENGLPGLGRQRWCVPRVRIRVNRFRWCRWLRRFCRPHLCPTLELFHNLSKRPSQFMRAALGFGCVLRMSQREIEHITEQLRVTGGVPVKECLQRECEPLPLTL